MVAWIALAVSAAALLWTVGWSVWQYRQAALPRLTVVASALDIPATTLFKPSFNVVASNTGRVPVTLTSAGVDVANAPGVPILPSHWKTEETNALPKLLEAGSGYWAGTVDLETLRQELTKWQQRQRGRQVGQQREWQVRARLHVAGGRYFFSDWITIASEPAGGLPLRARRRGSPGQRPRG